MIRCIKSQFSPIIPNSIFHRRGSKPDNYLWVPGRISYCYTNGDVIFLHDGDLHAVGWGEGP